jgi:drug/metabolite transporter (DMT)-like permease
VSRKGWLLFAALCLIWGIPYLLIRVAVRELAPETLIFLRTAPAALLLVPLAAHRGDLRLRLLLNRWLWILTYTAAELAVPWLLLSTAEERLSSSLSGLLIASVPLIGAVLYRFVDQVERLDRRRLVGLIVGFIGVAALVGIDVSGSDVTAVIEVAFTALGYTIGPLLISKRLSELPALGVVSVSVAITAIIYAPAGLTHLPATISLATALSVAGLAFVCTALAFVLFFALIIEVGPARSTVITYINPVVAVLLGVTVLGEPLTIGIAVGLPLILAGSVLATSRTASAEPLP